MGWNKNIVMSLKPVLVWAVSIKSSVLSCWRHCVPHESDAISVVSRTQWFDIHLGEKCCQNSMNSVKVRNNNNHSNATRTRCGFSFSHPLAILTFAWNVIGSTARKRPDSLCQIGDLMHAYAFLGDCVCVCRYEGILWNTHGWCRL